MRSLLSDTLRSKIPWMAPAVLAVMGWGAVASGSFQYDDFANILQDPATHHWNELTHRLATGIRPLTRLSYALSDELFGEWAGGWLLINLLLHLLTALGVAKLVHSRTLNAIAAALASTCFALQPANAAVVAYVSGRSTGLAAALLVAALLVHERSVRAKVRNVAIWWATLLFLCACACRETALVFPALVLLWERTRSVSSDWKIAFQRAAPYAIGSIAVAAVMLLMSPRYRELLAFSVSLRSPIEALFHNLVALPASFVLWFTPWALSVEHEMHFSAMALLFGTTAIIAMVAIAIWQHARRPFITLGLLWPLLAMLVSHSFIAKTDPVTEGALYLAWIGPSIALGEWFARRPRLAEHICVKGLAVALGALAIALCEWRVSVWSNPVALWEEATLRAPHSARAWTNLGVAHLAKGNDDSARSALRTALRLDPNDMQARFNLDIVAALAASARSSHQL